jgi:hypothetical protein
MKRVLLLLAGMLWFLFSIGFLFLLVQYIAGGAGLQFWIPVVSSGSVLMGLMHVVGLCTAAFLCFAIGSGLCAHGLVAERDHEPTEMQRSEDS